MFPFPLYPVLLDLSGRPCLVLGGGTVAAEKVRGLLTAGADVTVVSPDATEELRDLAARGAIRWVRRRYEAGDLAGHAFVTSATGNPDVNDRVAREARERNVFLNAADDTPRCSAVLPAVHRDGPLVIAVSTSGESPALAAHLRDRFADFVGPDAGALAEFLGEVRSRVHASVEPAERRAAWYRIVDALLDEAAA